VNFALMILEKSVAG